MLCNGRGSCEDGLLNYTCHCQPVYYGKDCENRKYNEYRVNATQFVQVLHLGLWCLDTIEHNLFLEIELDTMIPK